MRVLVIGGGAREHAIAWKLRQSKLLEALYCAPGNPGIGEIANLAPIQVDQIDLLLDFAKVNRIDFTIVGPELPLSLGVVDRFKAAGLKIFGPDAYCAQLESSKNFAKEVMIAAKVPTAEYQLFGTASALNEYIENRTGPIVLKADGLASGKGVVVCVNSEEAKAACHRLFLDMKAERVVAEEYLEGEEASYMVAANGDLVIPLATSHDYKRIEDGDCGPNTGGMGSVSPTWRLNVEQQNWVLRNVIRPVLAEMEMRGHRFCGFLYAGLMISKSGNIKVLEFNARLGDPETQSILRRMDGDLLESLMTLCNFELPSVTWRPEHAVTIVVAAAGYPDSPRFGDTIEGLEFAKSMPEVQVFHAGTSVGANQSIISSGGRVLSVSACGKTTEEARARAYRAVDMIQFKGQQVRRDIGREGL